MVSLVLGRPDVRRDVEIGLSLGLSPERFDVEVSEADQELLRADWQVRNDICSIHHGPTSECQHQIWYPQRTICIPAMELAAAERMYDQLHEKKPYHDGTFTRWSEKPSKAAPYHFRDGVRIWVSKVDVNPTDTFLTSASAPGSQRPTDGGDPSGRPS